MLIDVLLYTFCVLALSLLSVFSSRAVLHYAFKRGSRDRMRTGAIHIHLRHYIYFLPDTPFSRLRALFWFRVVKEIRIQYVSFVIIFVLLR
jgi:hypothetical protein